MKIIWARDRFEVQDSYRGECYANKETLKQHGFKWDNPNKVWYCSAAGQRLAGLRSLRPTITPEAKEKFEAYEADRQSSIQASRATDGSIEIPRNPGLDYLPYQRGGIAYALNHRDTLFGDEMGLGKTIQAIGAFNADADSRTALVICPASLKLNWKKELEKWGTKKSTVAVVNGGRSAWPETDVVIINYDLLHKYEKQIRAREWDVLVVDEAHYVKNPKVRRTQQIFGRKSEDLEPIKAKRRLFLTGTPIVNRPKELWPIIQALDPGFESSFMSYAKKYCGAFHNGYGWDFNGATNLEDLQERLRASFMVRRLKMDVLKELPPKRRQVLVLEAGAELKDILEKEKQTYEQFSGGIKESEIETPAFQEMSKVRKAVAVAKIPFLVEHVKEALDELDKVVVMVHHHEVVDALLDAFGSTAVGIDGRTANEDRQAAVDRFQTDPTCKVFVGTIRAAGVGITLTAASTVIFGELDWVPGNVTQAEDRCHRIGQKESVFIQHLVLDGSLDEKLAQTIIEKQEVIDKALDLPVASNEAMTPNFETESPTTPANGGESGSDSPVPQSGRPANGALTTTREEGAAGNSRIAPSSPRTFTDEQEQAVLEGLRILASMCDGAQDLDGHGFNKRDTMFGKDLATKSKLSEKQFQCAKKMIRLYHRQLPEHILVMAGVK